MARVVDESKLEKVKEAVISLIVEKGYANASTAMIAKRSGVSEGYLYRFYKKKYDLVYDVLQEKIYLILNSINRAIKELNNFDKITESVLLGIFSMAQNRPNTIKFLYVLMHDYNFEQSSTVREEIFKSCNNFLELGKKSNSIRDDVTIEELFQMVILYPIEFLNLRMKNFFKIDKITDKDIEKVTKFVLNSMR